MTRRVHTRFIRVILQQPKSACDEVMFLALLIVAGLIWLDTPLPAQDEGPGQEVTALEDRAANQVDATLHFMDFSADVFIGDVNGNGIPDFVAVLLGGSGLERRFATWTLTLILRTVTERTERDLVYLITPGKVYEIPIAKVRECGDMEGEEGDACLPRVWLEGEKPNGDPAFLDDLLSRPLPPSGYVRRYHAEEPLATVLISTAGSSLHYFVSIEDADTGDTAAEVFVRAGRDVLLDLSSGTYRLRYVTGQEWQGPEWLFGAETNCFEVEEVIELERSERLALGPDGLPGSPPAKSKSIECGATPSRI